MSLLMIESKAEKEFIQNEIVAQNLPDVWLGAKRTQTGSDIWRWGDNEAEWKKPQGTDKNLCLDGHYSNWNQIEPNDCYDEEDCIMIWKTYGNDRNWNDVACHPVPQPGYTWSGAVVCEI